MKTIRRLGAAVMAAFVAVSASALWVSAVPLGYSYHTVKQMVPGRLEQEELVHVQAESSRDVSVDFHIPAQSSMQGNVYYFCAVEKADSDLEWSFDMAVRSEYRELYELAVTGEEGASSAPSTMLTTINWGEQYNAAFVYTDDHWQPVVLDSPALSVTLELPNPCTIMLAKTDLFLPDPMPAPTPDPAPDPIDIDPLPSGVSFPEDVKETEITEDPIAEPPGETSEISQPDSEGKGTVVPKTDDKQDEEPSGDGSENVKPNGGALEISQISGSKQVTSSPRSAADESRGEPSAPQSPGSPAATGDSTAAAAILTVVSAAAAGTFLAARKMKKTGRS